MLRSFRIEPSDAADPFPSDGTTREQMMHLLRLAVLAPSIHNTQPWKFSVDRGRVGLFADRTRWLAAADPDQRDLRMSLGCVLENLLVAARHYGYAPQVTYAPRAGSPDFVAMVDLSRKQAGGTRHDASLEALKRRRTTYGRNEARTVTAPLLASLARACHENGTVLYISGDPAVRSAAAQIFREASAHQLADPKYRAEAARWLRAGEYGLPRAMRAIGRTGLPQLERALEKEAAMIESAPYFAVVLSSSDDPVAQLRAGQAFERVWLEATASRVGLRPASAMCQVEAMKARLARLVDAGELRVLQAFRLGYGKPTGKPSPRRKADASIIAVPLH